MPASRRSRMYNGTDYQNLSHIMEEMVNTVHEVAKSHMY